MDSSIPSGKSYSVACKGNAYQEGDIVQVNMSLNTSTTYMLGVVNSYTNKLGFTSCTKTYIDGSTPSIFIKVDGWDKPYWYLETWVINLTR